MGDSLVVGSKVKEAIKAAGCNCAGDVIEGLSGKVAAQLTEAATRAKANGRKTVRAVDL